MSSVYPIPKNDRLNRYVGFSIGVHVLILLIFTVKAFFAGDAIEYQSAVRVDLIGLPDKVIPEDLKPASGPAPEAPPADKTEENAKAELPTKLPKTDPDAINLDKNKSKQKDAMAKLKQMSAFEKIQQQELAEERKKLDALAAAKAKQIKGNQISSGSQLSGISRLQADNYIGNVERQIRANWVLPQYLAKKNLKAQVRVRFDETGQVLSAQIVKSSGNPTFDEIVIDTVQKSSPVPPPPEKFVRLFNLEGVLFGFPE
ncbi:MAG: energy transducer TonB [Bdellovibrio sp.]